jgi:hypothetical protein
MLVFFYILAPALSLSYQSTATLFSVISSIGLGGFFFFLFKE